MTEIICKEYWYYFSHYLNHVNQNGTKEKNLRYFRKMEFNCFRNNASEIISII